MDQQQPFSLMEKQEGGSDGVDSDKKSNILDNNNDKSDNNNVPGDEELELLRKLEEANRLVVSHL